VPAKGPIEPGGLKYDDGKPSSRLPPLSKVIESASAKHITVLLSCDAHDPSQAEPTFADRDQWKASQSYQ